MCLKTFKMADTGTLFSVALVIITFFLYGLKWAVLVSITVLLCHVFLSLSNSRGGQNAVKKWSNESTETRLEDHSAMDLLCTGNSDGGMESSGYGTRFLRNIVRRNPTLTQDLPFNDSERYKRSRRRQGESILRSQEPLLSRVTKHLSFNNTSCYYPNRTKLFLSSNDRSVLSPARQARSYTSPTWYSPHDTTLPSQSPSKMSSVIEERYHPGQFSIASPSRTDMHNVSTVKISRPGDDDSRFALESILHKRLERTKDNPCSRQSVLFALGQKNRKRTAYDCDSSLVESYSVKKRRRDDLDDFLEVVNDPLSSPSKYTALKSTKRPYADSVSEKPSLEVTRKRSKENAARSAGSGSSPLLKNSIGHEDSGVDLDSPVKVSQENLSQGKVVQPVKAKKRKSVTFSDTLVNGSSIKKRSPQTSDGRKTQNGDSLMKDSDDDNLPVFRTGFSPRKSLQPEYLSSLANRTEHKRSPRRSRGSNITGKDLQENRREAWRRSQKLLDEVEESFSREIGSTQSSVVQTISTTTMTSSLPSTAMSSLPVSDIPSTGVQTTTSRPKTILTGHFTNFSGVDQTSRTNSANIGSSNTLLADADAKLQSGILSGSTGTGGLTLDSSKTSSKSPSITGLFGGTSSTAAVSLSAPSLSVNNTSTKTNTTTQQSPFSLQPSVTSSNAPSITGISSTAHVTQNANPGLFNFKTSSQTTNGTGTSVSVGRSGLSFPASAVTKATSASGFSAPAVPEGNVSGGFTFATQQGQNTSAQKSSTFTAPVTEKPNITSGFSFTAPTNDKQTTSGGFTFTAPTNDKQATSCGFSFTAPTDNKQATSGGFSFTAPTNDKQATSGGFSFTAPTNDKQATSGGFSFTAPTDDKQATSGGFSFTAPTNNKQAASSGFSFTAPTSDKQATSSSFAFTAPSNNKQGTSGSFPFTAPTNDKANASGGFQFTAPANVTTSASGGFQFAAPVVPAVNNNNNNNFTAPTVPTANNSNGGFTFNAGNKPSNTAQNAPISFNFGSPAPAGGFNFAGGFASSTPIPTNSGRASGTVAKTRQRRRTRK